MASSWSVFYGFINQAGQRIELTSGYSLEDLVALASAYKKLKAGNIKAKFVVTWILDDTLETIESYKERGYSLEKMSIKRG